jgi:hypothetical protein
MTQHNDHFGVEAAKPKAPKPMGMLFLTSREGTIDYWYTTLHIPT